MPQTVSPKNNWQQWIMPAIAGFAGAYDPRGSQQIAEAGWNMRKMALQEELARRQQENWEKQFDLAEKRDKRAERQLKIQEAQEERAADIRAADEWMINKYAPSALNSGDDKLLEDPGYRHQHMFRTAKEAGIKLTPENVKRFDDMNLLVREETGDTLITMGNGRVVLRKKVNEGGQTKWVESDLSEVLAKGQFPLDKWPQIKDNDMLLTQMLPTVDAMVDDAISNPGKYDAQTKQGLVTLKDAITTRIGQLQAGKPKDIDWQGWKTQREHIMKNMIANQDLVYRDQDGNEIGSVLAYAGLTYDPVSDRDVKDYVPFINRHSPEWKALDPVEQDRIEGIVGEYKERLAQNDKRFGIEDISGSTIGKLSGRQAASETIKYEIESSGAKTPEEVDAAADLGLQRYLNGDVAYPEEARKAREKTKEKAQNGEIPWNSVQADVASKLPKKEQQFIKKKYDAAIKKYNARGVWDLHVRPSEVSDKGLQLLLSGLARYEAVNPQPITPPGTRTPTARKTSRPDMQGPTRSSVGGRPGGPVQFGGGPATLAASPVPNLLVPTKRKAKPGRPKDTPEQKIAKIKEAVAILPPDVANGLMRAVGIRRANGGNIDMKFLRDTAKKLKKNGKLTGKEYRALRRAYELANSL